MNLSRRGKWLTAIAGLIAGYVIFGPRDPDPVEPARRAAPAPVHTRNATSVSSVPVARSLLSLAHRVVEQTTSGSLFAVHSWYVAPPPPPPAVVSSAPVAPSAPSAPPLPFRFIGRYKPDGQAAVFFLTSGDRVYDVHVGDTLDNTYSIDSFTNGELMLTYKPLNIKQQLVVGVTP
ncbi:MAG: hypothetical protein ACRETG_09880 [Steroidobacteraceae bacterium]